MPNYDNNSLRYTSDINTANHIVKTDSIVGPPVEKGADINTYIIDDFLSVTFAMVIGYVDKLGMSLMEM